MSHRVRVYWNVKNHKFSVQHKLPQGWRLDCHVGGMFWYELENVKFHVSEKGRQRVLKTGQKNVHAWMEGDWVRDYCVMPFDPAMAHRVRYDPFYDEYFNILGTEIKEVDRLFFGVQVGRPQIYVD